jgi:hypothetical protein
MAAMQDPGRLGITEPTALDQFLVNTHTAIRRPWPVRADRHVAAAMSRTTA